jgi:hypothetical protein
LLRAYDAEGYNIKWHHAECYYAESRGAIKRRSAQQKSQQPLKKSLFSNIFFQGQAISCLAVFRPAEQQHNTASNINSINKKAFCLTRHNAIIIEQVDLNQSSLAPKIQK